MLFKWINKVLNEDSYKHKFWHIKTSRIVMDKTMCHSYKKTNYHKFFLVFFTWTHKLNKYLPNVWLGYITHSIPG